MLCTEEVFGPVDRLLDLDGVRAHVALAGRTIDEAGRALAARARDEVTPVGVIGLSLGAIVAMAAAAEEPDLFAAMVLMSTNARAPRADQRAAWSLADRRVVAGEFDAVVEELSPALWASGAEEDRLRDAARMARAVGPRAFRDQLAIQQSRRDLRPGLSSVSARALVLGGGADQLCSPRLHREIASTMPVAQLRELPSVGHLSTWESPALVAGLINDWWRAQEPPIGTAPTATRQRRTTATTSGGQR